MATVAGTTTTNTGQTFKDDLPQVFGRYLLVKRLSRGGMGEIFLGRVGEIQGFEKPVIIKKVLPNLAADEEFVKRFVDEAQVAIKLSHANIASVFEVGKVDGDYFIAIEYIEGRDLRRLLTRTREAGVRLPADLCFWVAREVANGLGYAHRRTDAEGTALALVHCDISPPNVMVSFEGEVKVIDFGIAKSAIRTAGSNPNMGFGKFGYMAPEQLVRGGIVDRRTDIYAAGVVLYELLTGERLFLFPEGADYRQIARIVTKGEFIPPSVRDPRLDPSLDPIVGKALAARADERYQSAEEFRDAVQSKLYQMNPTISGDALAGFMRDLFADEIDEERAIVRSAQDYDLEDFRDQLSGSVTHTVTFARAGLFGGRRSPTGSGQVLSADPSSSVVAPRRSAMTGLAVALAVIAGGLLTYVIAKKAMRPPPPVVVMQPQPLPPPVAVVAPPTAMVHVDTPTVVTPSHSTEPTRPRKTQPTKTVRSTEPKDSPPATVRSQGDVSSKFRTIKHEYESFKGEYGGRLEGQWTAIVNEITFGKADKFDKVDALLDALRRDMAKVRKGG